MPIEIDGTEYVAYVVDSNGDLQPYDVELGDGTLISEHSSAPDGLVDSFEDGISSEWSGATSYYSTTDAESHHGDYSVIGTTGTVSNFLTRDDESVGTSAEYSIRLLENSGSLTGVVFGDGDAGEGYLLAYDESFGELAIIELAGTSYLTYESASIPSGEWVRVVGEKSGDTYTVTLEDESGSTIASTSASDSSNSTPYAGVRSEDDYADTFINEP